MGTISIDSTGSARIEDGNGISIVDNYATFRSTHSLFHAIGGDKFLHFASGLCLIYYEGASDGEWKHDDFTIHVRTVADFLPATVHDKVNKVTRGKRLKIDVCVPSVSLDGMHKGVESPAVGWGLNDFGYEGGYIYGADKGSDVTLTMRLGVKGKNSQLLVIGYSWVMQCSMYDYEETEVPD